ncbi:hypothetical protein ACFRAR_04200 [Kitasatospora sp. NPDC056651]|uniref:hypothetical protein n=1 Tax=Kitasatospora sp. NPDC056651 TaxID=3345892 RepID=UPI0036B3D2FC
MLYDPPEWISTYRGAQVPWQDRGWDVVASGRGAGVGRGRARRVLRGVGTRRCSGQDPDERRLPGPAGPGASAICRGTVTDVRLALSAVRGAARGAAHAQVMVIVAASEATARTLVHSKAREALRQGLDVVKEAVGLADNTAVDVCLVDAPRADHGLVAEYAGAMTAQGAGTIVLADTVGDLLPGQTRDLFQRVAAGAGPEAAATVCRSDDAGASGNCPHSPSTDSA